MAGRRTDTRRTGFPTFLCHSSHQKTLANLSDNVIHASTLDQGDVFNARQPVLGALLTGLGFEAQIRAGWTGVDPFVIGDPRNIDGPSRRGRLRWVVRVSAWYWGHRRVSFDASCRGTGPHCDSESACRDANRGHPDLARETCGHFHRRWTSGNVGSEAQRQAHARCCERPDDRLLPKPGRRQYCDPSSAHQLAQAHACPFKSFPASGTTHGVGFRGSKSVEDRPLVLKAQAAERIEQGLDLSAMLRDVRGIRHGVLGHIAVGKPSPLSDKRRGEVPGHNVRPSVQSSCRSEPVTVGPCSSKHLLNDVRGLFLRKPPFSEDWA